MRLSDVDSTTSDAIPTWQRHLKTLMNTKIKGLTRRVKPYFVKLFQE